MRMKAMCFSLILFSAVIHFASYVDGARILGIFPLHVRSHFGMSEAVMKSLADAGHRVDVVSHFPLDVPYANYTDIINLAGTLPTVVNNITYESRPGTDGVDLPAAFDLFGTKVCELLELPEMQELIKNPPKDPPYDLVVAEAFVSSCYLAFGRHLKVPVVGTTSLTPMIHLNRALGNPHNMAFVSEISERPLSGMNFWQRLQNTLMISYVNAISDHCLMVQNDMVKKHFGPEMPDIAQLERDISLNLVNSHMLFNNVRPLTPVIVEIAGIHIRDTDTPLPEDLQNWLDASKNGVIFFSLGSMIKMESFPKSSLDAIFTAFARLAPLRFLMKMTKSDNLLSDLPENVRTLSWAPQVQILKHKNIRAFMTHGGLMGLYEAVTFAVPLIGIPLFGDQPGNIQMSVERGIAVSLAHDDLTTDKIISAVNTVVHDPTYKKNIIKISKQFWDRLRSPQETAVFWIEYILKYGSESLRSPAVNLSWWQLALLDVYASMIALVLLLLYIIKILLSWLYRRIFYSNVKLSMSKKRL